MIMKPSLRRLILTAHVTSSVGWAGAATSFLALNIIAVNSRNDAMVRGAYLSMNIIGLYAIIPLSLASLATALVQSLGTHWGLLRHYWVVAKLLLTILAVYALLMHQFAGVALAAKLVSDNSTPAALNARLHSLGIELLGDVSGGLLVLLVATTLAVYKPWGLTRYGRAKQRIQRLESDNNTPSPIGFRILLVAIGVLIIMFKLTLYLTGHTMHHVH